MTDIVLDSTGLKVYGEGEWKIRIHGKQKRRTWRKHHVAVDPTSHEIAQAGGYAVIPPRTGTCIVRVNPSSGEEQASILNRMTALGMPASVVK